MDILKAFEQLDSCYIPEGCVLSFKDSLTESGYIEMTPEEFSQLTLTNAQASSVQNFIDENQGNLSNLVQAISMGTVNISEDDPWAKIAKKVAVKFRLPESAWPYQLQLMVNAFLSEEAVYSALLEKAGKFRNLVLSTLGLTKNEIENAIVEPIGEHESAYTSSSDASKGMPDFVVKNGNELKTVEVKLVKGRSSDARNFHNADLIIIIDIQSYSGNKHIFWLKATNSPSADTKRAYDNAEKHTTGVLEFETVKVLSKTTAEMSFDMF